MGTTLKPKTVKLIARFIRPLCVEGLLSVPEMNDILGNLKSLAAKGEMLPAVQPKLIDQTEAAEMLGISLTNFKKMEREGKLPIPRKMVGSSVRYRNTDVIKYLLADDGEDSAPVEDGLTPTRLVALANTTPNPGETDDETVRGDLDHAPGQERGVRRGLRQRRHPRRADVGVRGRRHGGATAKPGRPDVPWLLGCMARGHAFQCGEKCRAACCPPRPAKRRPSPGA